MPKTVPQVYPSQQVIWKNIFLITTALLVNWASIGQIPKPMKDTYVDDFAKVLTADQVTALNKQIFDIEKQSSVQFAIVLVSKLPEGFDIEDYSLLLAHKWHVGKHKNGLVYVAAIKQHKQRLEVASGLDTMFTPNACRSILDAIKPSFKAGDYNAGLQTLVSQVQSLLSVATQPQVLPPPPAIVSQPSTSGAGLGTVLVLLIIGFFVVLIFYLFSNNRVRGNTVVYNNAGYNNQPTGYYNGQPNHHPGVGTFIAGAAAGYVASTIVEDIRESRNNNYSDDDSNANTSNDNSNDNTPSNWGNWGSGDDNSSNNDNSSDSSSGSSDTSNDDSGFSGSDSSGNDSGATSDW